MLERIRAYFPLVILVETMTIAIFFWLLVQSNKANENSVVLPSQDHLVSRETVTVYVSIKGLNKKEAQDKGIITKDVEKDKEKAVLASGHIEDASGSRNVSAVINVNNGITQIVEKRPFAETMTHFRIGAGPAYESGDKAKLFQLRGTFFRIDRVYVSGQAQLFEVDRNENKHPWNGAILIEFDL